MNETTEPIIGQEPKLYNKKQIRSKILSIMVPMALENLLQVMMGIVSSAMVGRLTVACISAQGMSHKLTDLIYVIYKGIGVGLTVKVSQKHAQGFNDECKKYFEQTVVSLLGLTVMFAAVFIAFTSVLLGIFSDEAELIEYAVPYLRLSIIGLPGWSIMLTAAAFYQGLGDTVTPMKIVTAINVINIVLGWLLIFGNFGAPELGYLGASISLVISRTSGAVIYLVIMYRKGGLMDRLGCQRRFSPAVDKQRLGDIYTLGVPAAGEYMNWQIGSMLLSIMVMSYGQEYFSAYQLGLQAEMITEVPGNGISVAATALMSAAFGLRDRQLYEIYEKEIKKICIILMAFMSWVLLFQAEFMMSLLTDKPELIKLGMSYVMTMGVIQIPQNLYKVNNGIIRSAGFKNAPFILHMIGTWGIRIPGAFICSMILKTPVVWVWIFMATDQTMKFVMAVIFKKVKRINEDFEKYAEKVAK